MTSLVIVILALVGFATLVALCIAGLVALIDEWQQSSPLPGPYREGLDASARISAMAFEAEQLMFASAEVAREEAD